MSELAARASFVVTTELPDTSEWFEASPSREVQTLVLVDDSGSDRLRSEIGLAERTWGVFPKSYPKVVSVPEHPAGVTQRINFVFSVLCSAFSIRASIISFSISMLAIVAAAWQTRAGMYLPVLATATTALCFACIGLTQVALAKDVADMMSRDTLHRH